MYSSAGSYSLRISLAPLDAQGVAKMHRIIAFAMNLHPRFTPAHRIVTVLPFVSLCTS
jgi:hypothetical protein